MGQALDHQPGHRQIDEGLTGGRPLFSAGQHKAERKGNAHTRCAHGTGTNSIIDTHFRPKQWMTWCLLDRTASR